MSELGKMRQPHSESRSLNGQTPSGVLRLLVSDTGRVDGIDVLGSVVGVPQLGVALIAGYHPDDIEAISGHLGALTARNGTVAHWDARVLHHSEWVWVYEYAIGRGHGAVDLIRVFPGRPGAQAPRSRSSEVRDRPHVVISIVAEPNEALDSHLAQGIESVLGAFAGVLDDWATWPAGGYRALMQDCALPQAEVVAAELRATLVRELGSAAVPLRIVAEAADCANGQDCRCLDTAPPAADPGRRSAGPGVLREYSAGLLPALNEQRLLLHLQPITRIGPETGEPIVAAEFLLRVHNGDGLIERPGLRLLETERAGGMHRVDRWVISQSFALLAAWPQALARLDFVTINLSGPSLGQPDLLAHVLRQFLDTGLPPEKLCFEITETAAIPDIRQARMLIEALQRRGCRFAIDDFGAGLASFHLLRALPVDLLKLDGRLFREPLRQLGLLRQLQHLGERLGKRTVAEHVETSAVCHAVRQIGVDYGQGHFFGEPESPEDFFGRVAAGG